MTTELLDKDKHWKNGKKSSTEIWSHLFPCLSFFQSKCQQSNAAMVSSDSPIVFFWCCLDKFELDIWISAEDQILRNALNLWLHQILLSPVHTDRCSSALFGRHFYKNLMTWSSLNRARSHLDPCYERRVNSQPWESDWNQIRGLLQVTYKNGSLNKPKPRHVVCQSEEAVVKILEV